MTLNGPNRLLHQEEHRVLKGKVTLARERFVGAAVFMTERLLPQPLASVVDDFIDPLDGMCLLHPNGNAALYLLCTYNSASTT